MGGQLAQMCQVDDVAQEENENKKLNHLIILYVVLTIVTMLVIKKLSQGGLVNHILSGKALRVSLRKRAGGGWASVEGGAVCSVDGVFLII